MKKPNKKNNPPVTADDVKEALQKFKEQGGLINQLPDEIIPRNQVVGSKFSQYEVLDLTVTA